LQGQVHLPPFQPWPGELQELYNDRNFIANIRQYNSALAFTSVGVDVDDQAIQRSGPSSFRIHGALHHQMGGLMPPEGQRPAYAQLYIYDADEATQHRAERNRNLDPTALRTLHDMLWRHHPYAPLYKQAYQVMREKPPEQHPDVRVRLHLQQGTDGRRYNLPTVNEVAAIIPGDGTQEVSNTHDIVLRLQGDRLQRISHIHPSYATLHYCLIN